MGTKKSVMLSDMTVAIMQTMTDKRNPDTAIAWSNLVNRGIIINDYLFRESLPELTQEEWQVILNAYTGTIGSIEHPPFRIASDLMDDLGLIDVEKHPNSELVKRIHNMTQVEQFAILSFVERFWNNHWDQDFDEIKRIITAKPELE